MYCIQNPCTRIDPVLNKIFSQCLRACLIFHSYTSGNPIVSYKREGDSTDGWTSSTSLGSSTAGDTFDWGSATSFTESREYAINVQLDPGVFVYFMSYIKRQLKKNYRILGPEIEGKYWVLIDNESGKCVKKWTRCLISTRTVKKIHIIFSA